MNRRKKYKFKRVRFTIFLIIVMIMSITTVKTFMGLNDASGETEAAYITVEVESGDNLWIIAEKYMPENLDPRKAVYLIKEANEMDNEVIFVGEELKIPTNHFD